MELVSWLILSHVLDRMLSLSPKNFIFSVISSHVLKPLHLCNSFPTSFKYNQVCSIKNKVLVSQSCLTLCDPMDCRPTRLLYPWISQARTLEWVCHALLQGIFLTQGSNQDLLHCRQVLYHLSQC